MGSMQLMSSFSPQVQANDPLLSGNSPRGKVCLYEFNLEKEIQFHYVFFAGNACRWARRWISYKVFGTNC